MLSEKPTVDLSPVVPPSQAVEPPAKLNPETTPPVHKPETNWRTLLITAGFTCLGIGGSPLVNYFSGESVKTPIPSMVVCVMGLSLLSAGFFYEPKPESKLFLRLGQWAASPVPYALILLCFWLYLETLAVQRANELAALRNDEQAIARVLDRGVLPRHLTKTQQRIISTNLQQYDPQQFAFRILQGDNEASSFGSDIAQALIKGGWTLSAQNPYEYTREVQEGLSIRLEQTQEHSQKQDEPRNPKPDRVLRMALGLAGVRLEGWGTGGTVSVDRVTIEIGRHRADSYQFTGSEPLF
jgi:hypothetical protein